MKWAILIGVVFVCLFGGTAQAHPDDPDPRLWPLIIDKYDTNGDGKIDSREYIQMYRDMQSESQGQIGWLKTTRGELVAWLHSLGYSVAEARTLADQILHEYDRNHDGVLDSQEWGRFWRDLRNRNQGGSIVIVPVPIGPGGPLVPAAIIPGGGIVLL